MIDTFPHFKQLETMDCGPTCLRMVARHYGKNYSLQYLRDQTHIDREGVSLKGIIEAAEKIGMRSLPIKVPFEKQGEAEAHLFDAPFPCIAHWRQSHFIVVYKANKKYVWVADPADGKFKLDHQTFKKHWLSGGDKGIALVLEPTPDFFDQAEPGKKKSSYAFLLSYLRSYKQIFLQLLLGLLLGSLFQLVFPFLTQSIVDTGIQNQNIGFINLILLAQLMVFLGQTSLKVIQNWLLLHVGTRINVSLVADFLTKLMKLPIGYFDAKMVGDLMQRIGDHKRIEQFLTNSTLQFIFSFFNLIIFAIVLFIYDARIFGIFAIASVLYLLWVIIFLRRRKEVDYVQFQEMSANQSKLIEIIQGMQEIKMQNSGRKRRWQWSDTQAKLFSANLKSLAISQYQDAGAGFIIQLKDILITFLTAKLVIEGQITLGMMLAVQFIIGQLNGPLQQMVNFIRTAQDAKISLERLLEIQQIPAEEEGQALHQIELVPARKDIRIEGLGFQYNPLSNRVLNDINLTIPEGKVTAVVGTSGSGKTTLMKTILGFYPPSAGSIKVGDTSLAHIDKNDWRRRCGAVLQDGYIFSDTIANNIAESDDRIDRRKLLRAVKAANIQEFIEDLPLGYNTIIGNQGNGLSQGQKQRILIARAIYKNPEFLFFDEATNALDAHNEKEIVQNLNQFFAGKTVVVIAHRLSTVKHADQIVVLDQGRIAEKGTHQELVQKREAYFRLVKDQLELGN